MQSDVSLLLPQFTLLQRTLEPPEPGAFGSRRREHTLEGYAALRPAACSELCRAGHRARQQLVLTHCCKAAKRSCFHTLSPSRGAERHRFPAEAETNWLGVKEGGLQGVGGHLWTRG